jgi:hypothetical protein
MFKKAEDIQPLPAGMVDAFTAKVASQGYKMPEPVAEEPVVEVEAQPEEVTEATGSRGSDKTAPGDGDTKTPKVADVTPEIGMISSKDKAAKSVETAVKAASKSQHEEIELVQDGGKVELEDVMYEATITVKSFTGKAPAGIKMKKIGSSSFGGDDVEMTGPDAKLIAYAKKSLGCDKSCKTIADVQKSLKESYMDEKSCVGEMKKLHASSCSKHEMYKKVSEKYGCSEAKFEELYAQYCKETYEGVQEDNSNDKSDDGEGMDKVQPKAVKKKFDDRKDKDIDNDGDEDESDEYLHKRRKAISKALED